MDKTQYDFSGWATRNDLRCSDGRVIKRNAFKGNNGQTVPLVWAHNHTEPDNVLGHALLENRDEGVYCYGVFNETPSGQLAKTLVQHGDITALSIYARELKQISHDVVHGSIKEVSLVHAGANPGAYIDTVIEHSDDDDEEAIIYTGEEFTLCHADGQAATKTEKKPETKSDDNDDGDDDETVGDVFNTLTEKQKKVVYAIVGMALGQNDDDDDDTNNKTTEGKENSMKHNVFDTDPAMDDVLSHSDQESIIELAKSTSVGSLQDAIAIYCENNKDTLAHGFDDIESLFPDYKDVRPGAPELLTRDQSWVTYVMNKAHKSPFSRIRTRQVDIRDPKIRASGYQKTKEKKVAPNAKLLKRTTDPQTVYRKDALQRDDIIDMTDFDVVQYQYGIMRQNLNEEIALAALVGDGREDGDEEKISEEHIRSIWHDDDLYTIHVDIDLETAKKELQGTNTSANFGENYIYAEAIISAALFAREDYKGSGSLDFFCTPHLLNVMLLARDLNGRRIYDSKADLAKALNVGEIHTVEQFEGLERTDKTQKKHKLLGLFVNMADYQFGSTKGGEITKFNQFDIDFNQEKYLIETRLSGALTRVYSAIALEEKSGE